MYKNEKPIQKSLLAHNIIAHLKISTKATKRLSGFTREFSKFASCKGYLCLGKKKNPMDYSNIYKKPVTLSSPCS